MTKAKVEESYLSKVCYEEVHDDKEFSRSEDEKSILKYSAKRVSNTQCQVCKNCLPKITFLDEDLLLGSKPYNQPVICGTICA